MAGLNSSAVDRQRGGVGLQHGQHVGERSSHPVAGPASQRVLTSPAAGPATWVALPLRGRATQVGHPRGASPRWARMSQRTAASPAATSEPWALGLAPPSRPSGPLASSMRADLTRTGARRRRRDRTGTQRDCGSVLIPHEVGVMKSIGGTSTRSTGAGAAPARRLDVGATLATPAGTSYASWVRRWWLWVFSSRSFMHRTASRPSCPVPPPSGTCSSHRTHPAGAHRDHSRHLHHRALRHHDRHRADPPGRRPRGGARARRDHGAQPPSTSGTTASGTPAPDRGRATTSRGARRSTPATPSPSVPCT